MKKISVAILGATGTVGQKFISLLEHHPWFEIRELVASERSAGQKYGEVCHWREPRALSSALASLVIKPPTASLESVLLFSGLDSSVAGEIEARYAHDGHVVISNSSNHRLDTQVPLVIPEINANHLRMVQTQPYRGAIITNPNCSTMFLSMTLAPLYKNFGIKHVIVTTMQAISGAGYPGVASLDILGNIIPYIAGEEQKIETEPLKILGTWDGAQVIPASFSISAQCNRVPVVDGHCESISIAFDQQVSVSQVKNALRSYQGEIADMALPSAPSAPIIVLDQVDRPQARLDVNRAEGMSTIVGRIRSCPVLDIKMVILGHNTIRGAAGAALLNAELCYSQGILDEYRL